VAFAAARSALLLQLVAGRGAAVRRGPRRTMTWPVAREAATGRVMVPSRGRQPASRATAAIEVTGAGRLLRDVPTDCEESVRVRLARLGLDPAGEAGVNA
jgi:hypothetical protein